MWSKHNPSLQLIWDATSLRALQQCPRRYFYSIVSGWREREEREDLTFGTLFQAAVERFQKGRLRGLPLEEAGLDAFTFLVQASGEYVPVVENDDVCMCGAEMDKHTIYDGHPPISMYTYHGPDTYTFHPFAGHYATEWRCTGNQPYLEAGIKSKKKCPNSHKGKWFGFSEDTRAAEHDGLCPICLSHTETATHWHPDHPTKNRETLLRAFVAFWDSQDETKGLQPLALPDGTPAVELNVVVPMGRKAPHPRDAGFPPFAPHLRSAPPTAEEAEDYLLAANFDEINTWGGKTFPTDNKTTKNALGDYFFQGFAPDTQFDLYDLIGSIYPATAATHGGCAVRGVQVTQTEARVATALVTKTEGQREELWEDMHAWVEMAERYAETGYYPMNRANCKMCPFRQVCDAAPSKRQELLEAHYVRKMWSPITRDAVQILDDNVSSPYVGRTAE